jgi:hypothetical protein
MISSLRYGHVETRRCPTTSAAPNNPEMPPLLQAVSPQLFGRRVAPREYVVEGRANRYPRGPQETSRTNVNRFEVGAGTERFGLGQLGAVHKVTAVVGVFIPAIRTFEFGFSFLHKSVRVTPETEDRR